MGLDDLAAIANATAKAAAVGCWRILKGFWPHAVLVADILGAATSRPVEMTKAARDLCRAAFGDELPDTPVPFIT
jgi:hypothetical protein